MSMPKIENFLASDGRELRELFARAVLQALTPKERETVLKSLNVTNEHPDAQPYDVGADYRRHQKLQRTAPKLRSDR